MIVSLGVAKFRAAHDISKDRHIFRAQPSCQDRHSAPTLPCNRSSSQFVSFGDGRRANQFSVTMRMPLSSACFASQPRCLCRACEGFPARRRLLAGDHACMCSGAERRRNLDPAGDPVNIAPSAFLDGSDPRLRRAASGARYRRPQARRAFPPGRCAPGLAGGTSIFRAAQCHARRSCPGMSRRRAAPRSIRFLARCTFLRIGAIGVNGARAAGAATMSKLQIVRSPNCLRSCSSSRGAMPIVSNEFAADNLLCRQRRTASSASSRLPTAESRKPTGISASPVPHGIDTPHQSRKLPSIVLRSVMLLVEKNKSSSASSGAMAGAT